MSGSDSAISRSRPLKAADIRNAVVRGTRLLNKFKAIAQRIVASGEAVESYLDVKLAVPESRYTNWPLALQQQFADARTVEAGKATFELSCDEGGL